MSNIMSNGVKHLNMFQGIISTMARDFLDYIFYGVCFNYIFGGGGDVLLQKGLFARLYDKI